MACPRCQQENPTGAHFCMRCGAGLTLTCAKCNTALPTGAVFCFVCGHPVAAVPAEQRFAAPDAYTPRHLAEKILTSKSALEGERKQVTVLFADLKGSMELLADRDPEEARKLLDPVLERMMEAVHRYEGTVNQVMGDGIMALFGAPLAHEDHAVRACYAALRMQESVAHYAEGVFRLHGVPIQIRVGLNSGEVVVRAIGSDLHMDYTAVGQTTHLAARMEQMATPGTILLAPATLQLAEGYVQVTARGPVAVKGLVEPVEVYVLTGASALRTRLHAAAARGLTRFVGRDAELEHLRRTLTLAHDGRGQLVAVVGEPGVGKSRLAYEFTHSHRTQGWLILEASSASYGKAISYLPVVDLLKTYFRIHDRESHRGIREKVTGKVLTLDRALEPIVSPLLSLLGASAEDTSWQALDPAERRQRTLDAVKHLLLRESQGQPVLLVFEDLHWIDAESQVLLDALVESLPKARLLFLVNYRPEYQHSWVSKTYYSQLRLDALPAESAGELLSALLGDEPGLEPLKRLLVKRGNPFFIEESIRTLVETGALAGRRGAYRLTHPIQAIEVPPTVQVMLAARIDRLSADDKRLLQTASAIGKDVPLVLLRAVAEAPEEAVHRGLSHLQEAEFLYETRLFPDPEFAFRHALTHEVTYGTLLQERRKALHAQIVRVIERCYPDRLSEHVERLAHHAVRGELWDQAVTYLQQAAARAFGQSANRAASTYLEQAIDALKRLPERPSTLEAGIDIRFELRNAISQTTTGYRGLIDHLKVAETLSRALGDRQRLGRALDYQSNYWRTVGDLDQAITLADRSLTIAEELSDVGLAVAARFHLGMAYQEAGDYGRAMSPLLDNVILLGDDDAQERFGLAVPAAVLSRVWLAFCLAETGEFHEGIKRADEARHLAEHTGRRLDVVYALRAQILVYLGQGDFERVGSLSEQLLTLSASEDLAIGRPTGAAALGYARALCGQLEEGRSRLEEALSALTSMGSQVGLALFRVWQSEVLGLQGNLEEAERQAQGALDLARERGCRGYQAYALRLLAELAVRRTSHSTARTRYGEALVLAEKLGMRPLVAHCHLGLGKLSGRTGTREEAREHFTRASTMYREMDMPYWLGQAKMEMSSPV